MPHATRAGIRRIRDATDLGSTPGAGNDGYVLTWNNSTSAFVLSSVSGGSGSPGGSTTQVQYNNAGAFAGDAGLTYDAATDRLTIAGGIVAPSMRPASNSTTALQLQNAAGTAVVTVDTTNGRQSSGYTGAPAAYLDTLIGDNGTTPGLRLRQSNVPTVRYWDMMHANNTGTTALQFQVLNSGTTYYSLFVSQTGQVGVGQWSALAPSYISSLDSFSIFTPGSLDSNYRGISILDTSVPRMYLQVTNSSAPRANAHAVQVLHINSTGDLAIASRGTSTTKVRFYTGDGTTVQERGQIDSNGYWAIGHTATATATADIAASTSTRASLRIRSGTAPTTPNDGDIIHGSAGFALYNVDAGTNDVISHVVINRQSSATPAAGFGSAFATQLESSTTNDRDAGRLSWEWVTATDASRASRGKLSAYSVATEQTAMTWDGDAGGLKLSFYPGITPVARQLVPTGSSVDTVITALQNLGLFRQS